MSWFKASVDIAAAEKVRKRLEAMTPNVRTALGNELAVGTLMIEAEAKKSIQEHRSAGATYTHGTVSHTASAPGNPPNTDTGNLVKSIGSEIDKENLVGRVGTSLNYGAFLEFGTNNTDARPWLGPAFKKVAPTVTKNMQAAAAKGATKMGAA